MDKTSIGLVLYYSVGLFFRLLEGLLFVRIILSWLTMIISPRSWFYRFIYKITEPIMAPARNLLRKTPLGGPGMMIDFSPMITFFMLEVIYRIIITLIINVFIIR